MVLTCQKRCRPFNLFITSIIFIFKRESIQPDLHDDAKFRLDFVHILIGKE
jgi:hypothetical protein